MIDWLDKYIHFNYLLRFSTLNTTIPNDKLKSRSRLVDIIDSYFLIKKGSCKFSYFVIKNEKK